MQVNILNVIKKIFSAPSEQSRLESFIVSKNPKSASDVEHWTRYFYSERSRFL